MKHFILKIILFMAGIVCILAAPFYINKLLSDKNVEHALYIWGDSQAYQGIDLNVLAEKTGKKMHSAAHHGAGVYDFLVFTDLVPKNSHVLIANSELIQIRRKEKDYNRSGLSFNALIQLYKNNYSLKEILGIIAKNKRPQLSFSSSTSLFSYADSISILYQKSYYEEYFKKIPPFLHDKQRLYSIGIENLKNKDCKISMIEFPFHKDLTQVIKESPIQPETQKFKHRLLKQFSTYRIDTIFLNENINMYNDLCHLNDLGAKTISENLAGRLSTEHNETTLFVIK